MKNFTPPLKSTKTLALTGFLASFVFAVSPAQAASIARADFSASAVNFNFESVAPNSTSATDGYLSVTNGVVTNIGVAGTLSSNAYYDVADSSVIRFDFLNPVSAFGVDFIAFNANITLNLFRTDNSLLESSTLDWTTLPTAVGFPNGFIGLDVGSNLIAYATIDTPLNGNELYVDNAIYQTQAVPEPLTILGAMTAAGFGAGFKRKLAKAQKDKKDA